MISIHRVPAHFNPHWVYFGQSDGCLQLSTGESQPIPRRQELPPAFHRSGSIYVSRTSTISQYQSRYGRRIVGYETPTENSCNIDTMDDWARAEALVAERGG